MSRGNVNKSNTDELLWVIVFLFVGIIALWYFGHEKISTAVMSLRRFETSLILFDADGKLALIEWLSSTHPADATPKSLWSSGIVASRELRWYVLAILTGVFGYLMYRAPDRGNKYSNKHTTTSLAKQEASQWPVILPALETDFIALPLNHSVHGMRAKVRDYARRHQFLVRTAALGEKEDPADIELLDNKEALKLSRARAILVAQLGKPWEGVDALKPYERSLFAAFAAQMNHDNDLALKIINELARAYVRAKRAKKIGLLNSLHAKRALHQYGNTKVVKRVVSRYAYKRTVLMGMKAAASANGVLAPNWFRWLKAVDRVTWYALCDIGMDVASVEACGLRSHWLSEVVAKSAIMNPRIDAALAGIKVALGEMVDEESDD